VTKKSFHSAFDDSEATSITLENEVGGVMDNTNEAFALNPRECFTRMARQKGFHRNLRIPKEPIQGLAFGSRLHLNRKALTWCRGDLRYDRPQSSIQALVAERDVRELCNDVVGR
jgi:hypothetical protein